MMNFTYPGSWDADDNDIQILLGTLAELRNEHKTRWGEDIDNLITEYTGIFESENEVKFWYAYRQSMAIYFENGFDHQEWTYELYWHLLEGPNWLKASILSIEDREYPNIWNIIEKRYPQLSDLCVKFYYDYKIYYSHIDSYQDS